MKKYFKHIILFLLLGFYFSSYAQSYDDEDSQEITNLDELLEDIKVDNNESVYEDYENTYYNNRQEQAQQDYLETPIEKKKFNREKWKDLRRQAVREALGESENFDPERYRNGESPYGSEGSSFSQNPYEVEQKEYERYFDQRQKNSEDVNYRPKEIKQRPITRSNRNFSGGTGLVLGPVFTYILLGIIIAILVGLIFYLFFKNPPTKENKPIPQDLEEINPTEIPKSELELRLEEALRNKDYRKAIRIYFIFIIRGLTEKNFIAWEKEKTNFAYLSEMRQNHLYKDFDESVMLYEIVWYGKRKIDSDIYAKLEPTFKTLIKNIEK